MTPGPAVTEKPSEPSGKGVGGKGKGQSQGKPDGDFDWENDCRGCKYFGRPFKHEWRNCEFSRKLMEMKEQEAQSPEGRKRLAVVGRLGKGKGKGKGKGTGGGTA